MTNFLLKIIHKYIGEFKFWYALDKEPPSVQGIKDAEKYLKIAGKQLPKKHKDHLKAWEKYKKSKEV